MRVKIIKTTSAQAWYSGQVGLEFNVEENKSGNYKLIGDVTGCFIMKSDCEVLPDEQPAQPEPFDLDRALKGEKVVTRNGREVTQITHFECLDVYSVHGVIDGFMRSFRADGSFSEYLNHLNDLFMAPKESQVVTRWVNVFRENDGKLYTGRQLYDYEADNYTDAFVGSFPLTITLKPTP